MTEKKYTLEEVNDLHKAIGSPVQDRNSNPADNTWFALKDAIPVMTSTDSQTAIKLDPKNSGVNRDKVIIV